MSRPLYETQHDLDNELDVIQRVEDLWNCKCIKLPIKYKLDFAILREDFIASWMEIKSPKYSMADFARFGGFFISLEKWQAARQLYETTGLPFIMIVNAIDGIWYSAVQDFDDVKGFRFRGRKDRDDWQDMEPCAVLWIKNFRQLGR